MLVAVKQVLDYMEALNDTVVDAGGNFRKESKLFDFTCFGEAWLNACLHNCWSRQTPPAVYMFEDRIEIISVGGLPDGLTLDDFITVTIPLNRKNISEMQMIETEKQTLNERDEKILKLMEENSRIIVSEISRKMGIGATTITKRIKYLKDQELVVRNSSKKSGQWVVNWLR